MNKTIASSFRTSASTPWQPRQLHASETRMVAGAGRYEAPSGSVYYRVNGVWWVEDMKTGTSHKL